MTTTPTTAAKRWPFVESPGDFAKRLERAIWSFSGDTLAAVRNVLIENPPTFATPAETAQPATPEPELLQAPQLPSDLIQRISEYGDARADDGNTGEALAVAIRAIRAWGAALATQASALQAAIPAQQPVAWCQPIQWPHSRSTEQVVKLTRNAQPAYGFTIPLYASPTAQTKDLGDAADAAGLSAPALRASAAIPIAMTEKLGDMRHYLRETAGFASLAPRARENINTALELLDELAALEHAPAEKKRLDEIEHAQDRDCWRTERERLDSIDKDDEA